MRTNKPAQWKDLSIGKRTRQIFRTSLITSYNSIAGGKVEDMRDGLKDLLKDVRQEFALAQLLLLDERGTVTLALLSYPSNYPSEAQDKLAEVESRVLGWKLPEDAFIRRVPEEYSFASFKVTERTLKDLKLEGVPDDILKQLESMKNEQPKGDNEFVNILKKTLQEQTEKFKSKILEHAKGELIAGIHLTEEELRKERESGNVEVDTREKGLYSEYYYTYKLIINEDVPGVRFGKELGLERLSFPFRVSKKSKPWIEKVIITGRKWPRYGSLPTMSSVLIFTLSPKNSMKGPGQRPKFKEQRRQNFKEQLREYEYDLYFLSWYILYSTFIFQTYALSQASADEPRRLYQELSRVDWSRLLGKAHRDGKKLLKRVTDMLMLPLLQLPRTTSEFEFAKRRVLREFTENYPAGAEYLCKKLVELLEPYTTKNKDLLCSILKHVKALYPSLSEGSKKEKCLKMAWFKVRSWLLRPSEQTEFSLALSAAEDIYRESGSTLQAKICDSLISLISKSIQEANVDQRFVEVVLVLLAYRKDNSYFKELVEVLCDALVLASNRQIPVFECVFATLTQPDRETIIKQLRNRNKSLNQFVAALVTSTKDIKNVEIKLSEPSMFAAEDGKPGLKFVPVLSQKGGTGKTVIALALASMLAQQHHKVCLIDLDFFGPTSTYLPDLQRPENLDKIYLNQYLKEHFDFRDTHHADLPDEQSQELLDKTRWGTGNPMLKIIPCAVERQLEDYMRKLLIKEISTDDLKEELSRLASHLFSEDYEYVIFDTPAEFKEVTLAAESQSLQHRGVNVFVSTLFDPALQPLLKLIPLEYTTGKNCLLINKVRQLDKQYVQNKTALVDFLGTLWSADQSGETVTSETLMDRFLKVEYCGPVAWSEKIEKFLATTRWSKPDTQLQQPIIETMAESLKGDLDPVIQLISGRNDTRG